MDIERIEDWVGQEVVDPDGEKVGKLEDVFYAQGGNDALAASVKSGMLGRKLNLVPLDGAAVSREHIRIAHSRERVKNAPETNPGADLASSTVAKVAEHFGVSIADGELESGTIRAERELKAREAEQRADELEKVAEAKKGEAEQQHETSEQSREAAEAAEQERQDALSEAAEARRSAGS